MRVHFQNKRGGVLVQVVIALVVLFGFTALTTDYGLMAVRQRKLQSATDAAALAAGPEMYRRNNPRAAERAMEVAAANGLEPGGVSAEWSGPTTFQVSAWSDVNTPFLRVLDPGKSDRRVSAVSEVAAFSPMVIDITAKVRPWGIPVAYFNPDQSGHTKIRYNEQARLRLVPNVDENPLMTRGEYFIQPFALSPSRLDAEPEQNGFPNYSHDVRFGYDQSIGVTDAFDGDTYLRSQPGAWENLVNTTYDAVEGESGFLTRARENSTFENDTFEDYNPENPRLIFLPVYDRAGLNPGDVRAQILGFTAFYVEDMEQNGVVSGYFVPYAIPFNGQALDPYLVTTTNMGIIQFHLTK